MATIFITGGTGFVGRNIIRTAISHGHQVKALVRSLKKAKSVFGSLKGLEFFEGDISDVKSITYGMKDCDAVIHLVGIIVEMPLRGVTFAKVHYRGTVNVVDAAKHVGIKRFVHMSALGTRQKAASKYHRTKFAAEEYLVGSGLNYTIFRPSIIFGEDDAFINMFAKIIGMSPFVPLIGRGKNKLQPIWAGDVAEFFIQAVEQKKTIGMAYGLGGPKVFTMDELIDVILNVMKKRRIKIHLPVFFARLNASLLERVMEAPPLTKDQLIMLKDDNICTREMLCDSGETMRDFEIDLKSVEDVIREYI